MKLESLKNNYVRNILFGLIGMGLILLGMVIGSSKAKYQKTQDIKLVEGLVNFKSNDLNIIALYKETSSGFVEINEVPSGGGIS